MSINNYYLNLLKEAHAEVVADASAALAINPTYTKALLRRAQANEALDKLKEAFEGKLSVISSFCSIDHL